jgi:hypothetical protein
VITRLIAAAGLVMAAGIDLSGQQAPTEAQMRAMLEKTQPTAQHQELAALVGRWTQEVTYRMGGQAMTTKGTTVNRMILGGRFLVSESTSAAWPGAPAGSAMETTRIYGFDRRTSQYTIIELDSMGTYWVSASGTKRDASTILMSGESLDDHGGAPEMRKFDMVLRVIDTDTYVTEVIFKFPGRPDLKLVEVIYRRLK